jgi:hypothetical protein
VRELLSLHYACHAFFSLDRITPFLPCTGLFNTLYYTVAFVFVWFSIANVPSGEQAGFAGRGVLCCAAS